MLRYVLPLVFIVSLQAVGQTYSLNKKLEDITLPDQNGVKKSISSLQPKKLIIVELWATWCAPCVKEMTKVPELRIQHPELEFYSISIDQKPEQMRKFIEKKKYDWPIVYAGDNEFIWNYFQIKMIPRYFFVDGNGILVHVAENLDEEIIKKYL